MKHLRLFETENEYQEAINTLDLPCITYVEETSEIGVYPKVNCCIATYGIADTLSSSTLLGDNFDTSQIKTMFIDGVEVEPISQYTFTTTGEHTVKIILNNNFTNAGNMFACCTSLTSLDLSNFDTSNVREMIGMFAYCTSLTSLDLSNFDTSKVISSDWMVANCSSLTSLKMMGDINKMSTPSDMFYDITTTGTFYYNSTYDYSKIISVLPSTWTAVAV